MQKRFAGSKYRKEKKMVEMIVSWLVTRRYFGGMSVTGTVTNEAGGVGRLGYVSTVMKCGELPSARWKELVLYWNSQR